MCLNVHYFHKFSLPVPFKMQKKTVTYLEVFIFFMAKFLLDFNSYLNEHDKTTQNFIKKKFFSFFYIS